MRGIAFLVIFSLVAGCSDPSEPNGVPVCDKQATLDLLEQCKTWQACAFECPEGSSFTVDPDASSGPYKACMKGDAVHGPMVRFWYGDFLQQVAIYTDNVGNGYFIRYWGNGTLRDEGCVINGQERGVWDEYHDNGQLVDRGSWSGDIPCGTHQCWTIDGDIVPCSQATEARPRQFDNCVDTPSGADCGLCQ